MEWNTSGDGARAILRSGIVSHILVSGALAYGVSTQQIGATPHEAWYGERPNLRCL